MTEKEHELTCPRFFHSMNRKIHIFSANVHQSHSNIVVSTESVKKTRASTSFAAPRIWGVGGRLFEDINDDDDLFSLGGHAEKTSAPKEGLSYNFSDRMLDIVSKYPSGHLHT